MIYLTLAISLCALALAGYAVWVTYFLNKATGVLIGDDLIRYGLIVLVGIGSFIVLVGLIATVIGCIK